MGNSLLLSISRLLFSLLALTWKMKRPILDNEQNIISFWHSSMVPCWYLFKNKGAVGVVSKSKDGEILSNLLFHWGFQLIRGSSSSGGSEVLKEMVLALSNKKSILITPDGPRGPKESFKVGAVIASQRSQVPILLVKPAVSRSFTFQKSWDKFSIPLPFVTIHFETKKIAPIPVEATNDEVVLYAKQCEEWLQSKN